MKTIDYSIIKDNLSNMNKNTILVVKDDAYGCGLMKVVNLAYGLGFTFFAVNHANDALNILHSYKQAHVLILGKDKIITRTNIYITVENEDDYRFACEYNIPFHLKVKSKMNRFGVTNLDSFIDSPLCKGVYFHIGENEKRSIFEELEYFTRLVRKVSNKLIHVGGSKLLDIDNKFIKRVGIAIYHNSMALFGKVIKIREIDNKESVGYKSDYKVFKKRKIALVDIGYNSGLSRLNRRKYVYINGCKYSLVGYKCMDYSYVAVDEKVNEGDTVEFLGENISIEELSTMEDKTEYELLLSLK